MLTYMSFLTSAICRAVLIFCLGSPVEFYLQDMFSSFEVLLLQGQRLRCSVKIMLTMILCCDAGTGYLIGTASSVLLLDHGLCYYLSPTSSSAETAIALLRESYTIF